MTSKFKRLYHSLFGQLSVQRILLATLGSLIASFGLFNIHAQSGVTEGGVLGLVLLMERWFNISPAITSLILNAACYLLGWRLLGGDFIGCSIVACGTFSIFYAIFEAIGPLFPGIASVPLAAALIGALFIGVGVGLSVRAGGAQGGDDALAMSLAHITHLNIKWIYLFSDLIVLALSLTYIPIKQIVFSLLTVLLSGQIIGFVAAICRKKQPSAD